MISRGEYSFIVGGSNQRVLGLGKKERKWKKTEKEGKRKGRGERKIKVIYFQVYFIIHGL